jgi:hypothetical protein
MAWMAAAALALQGAQAAGLFGNSNGSAQGLTTDQKFGNWGRRNAQIGNFANTLKEIRERYKMNSTNFYSNTFKRFGNDINPHFAVNGGSTQGGPFAAALARQASIYQDKEMMDISNMENADAKYIDTQYANNENSLQSSPFQSNQPNPMAQFANSASGSMMNYALMNGGNSTTSVNADAGWNRAAYNSNYEMPGTFVGRARSPFGR